MKITVDRLKSGEHSTISKISIDGIHECYGLENIYREIKVCGETRIPAGIYKIRVRTFGGFNSRYKKKFGDKHKGMLEIVDVPGFTDVLIHIGNYHTDTAGCILVGMAQSLNVTAITHSTDTYLKLYEKVIDAALNGQLTIEIIDNDR